MAGHDDVGVAGFSRRHGPALKCAPLVIVAHAARVVVEVSEDVVERRESKTTNPSAHPYAQLGEPATLAKKHVVMMPVREQDASSMRVDQKLLRRRIDVRSDEIVIAVNVRVVATLEARSDLRVGAARAAQRRRVAAKSLIREGFPNIAEKNDAFEVPFEEAQKSQKFRVVMAEPVGSVTVSQMKIRNNSYLHRFGSSKGEPPSPFF